MAFAFICWYLDSGFEKKFTLATLRKGYKAFIAKDLTYAFIEVDKKKLSTYCFFPMQGYIKHKLFINKRLYSYSRY